MPVIRRAAHPYMDEQGFWVDLDVSYGGGFQMAIETKVNLMKLKQSSPTLAANADRYFLHIYGKAFLWWQTNIIPFPTEHYNKKNNSCFFCTMSFNKNVVYW